MSDKETAAVEPHLNIKIKDSCERELYFLVKQSTKMDKLRKAWVAKIGCYEPNLNLCYDGLRVSSDDTPESVSPESLLHCA